MIRNPQSITEAHSYYRFLLMHRNFRHPSSIFYNCSLRNADLAQTFKQFVRTRSHSYRRKRLARRYLTKIRAIKCHVLHALSLSCIYPTLSTPDQFCCTLALASTENAATGLYIAIRSHYKRQAPVKAITGCEAA